MFVINQWQSTRVDNLNYQFSRRKQGKTQKVERNISRKIYVELDQVWAEKTGLEGINHYKTEGFLIMP